MIKLLTKGQKKFNDIIEKTEQFEKNRNDYTELLHNIDLSADRNTLNANFLGETKTLTDYATIQLGQWLKVPMPSAYSSKISPELFKVNFDHQKFNTKNNNVLIRTHEDMAIGFLSDSYKPIDNFQVLNNLGSAINENYMFRNDFDIYSRKVNFGHHSSSEKMNVKIMLSDLKQIGLTPSGKADYHKIGFYISNSELGKGALTIKSYIFRVVCENGLIRGVKGDTLFRQVHLSKVPDYVLKKKIEAGISNAIKIAEQTIVKLQEAKQFTINDVEKTIEQIAKNYDFNKKLTEAIKLSFEKEPINNKFYLIQAITDASKTLSEDDQIRVETIASRILVA